jgi:hypothetical protein
MTSEHELGPTAVPTVVVIGAGAVGARVVRQLEPESNPVRVHDIDPEVLAGCPVDPVAIDDIRPGDIVVLAVPAPQAVLAAQFVGRGCPVITTSDDVADIAELVALAGDAEHAGVSVVVGAGASPGLTGLLARHMSASFDEVDEVHVAVHGTGGPACARQHHRALAGRSVALYDGTLEHRPGGSGRELCWFPPPIGARDCYRAELADPLLLARVFPTLQRISARLSATRRDRFTARLPMLTPPHEEGGIGAIRVELRGVKGGARETVVVGVSERKALVAAAVAASCVTSVAAGRFPPGVVVLGDERLLTKELLADVVRRGIVLHRFVGSEEAKGS